MRWTWCVVMIGALGCDSGGPSCKDAVAAAKLPADLVDACKAEGWSAEVRACLAKSTSDAQADACTSKLGSPALAAARAERERARAEAVAQQAIKDAQAAKASVDQIQRDLDTLDTRISDAISAVANAEHDDERSAARAQLMQLQREQYEIKQRMAAAQAAAARAERSKGVHISQECLDNPLAKGCS